ncbi:LysR family transcriptional regulator [Tumebacillus avium]|uniref:LysR family transcriptional regulator n=1 Tax=Tumebacillus avium TaxID=1903704 RepID=A0A1Y0IJW9_9BACL|nr:LysR family transcriptional regulator [Tumebacillus avium]ARU60777.1 LysR family transcriptional regulator [Tumebacillus avium]
MDLKTIKSFHLILKYGSFNRAAEELKYAQSTVTMQIQKLESDLGVQLLERGKKIRLTEAGRLFYEQSLQILKNVEQLQTDLADLQVGAAGSVRLGVTEPTASYRLPEILKSFFSSFPRIKIAVDIANTPTLSERLQRGELDLALCSAPEQGGDLYFEPLLNEEFAVLLPENHPLADKEVLALHDLQNQRLLITSATCPYRRKLELLLHETGSRPADTMEIGSMTALKYYVKSDLGIALVPKIVLDPAPAGTTARTLSGSPIEMTFGILCKTSAHPMNRATAQLYQFLMQNL